MKLPAFALFERSLRVETRSALMCWSRAGLLGIILLILFPIQAMGRLGFYSAPGLRFLEQMVWVNFIFITLAGLSYFASAITEEKEETMLGLLRMTGLNGVAILLGKSTSRLIGALLLLVAQIPFILLAVTLGGVGLLQIEAAYGTLLAYVFLVCNLALLFSVLFRNTTTAAGVTLGVLLFFLLAHYWAAYLLGTTASPMVNLQKDAWFSANNLIDLWRQATPSSRLGEIFQTGFTGPAIGFQVASNLVLGVLLFLLSWASFDRFTREEKESAPSRRWLSRSTTRQSRIPPGLVGSRAITWKDFNFISGGRFGLMWKFAIVAGLMVFCNVFALETGSIPDSMREFEGTLLFWISILATALFLALDAGRVFREEIRWKTLSSLITLPISVPELAYRKVAGTLAGTLPLLAGVLPGALLAPKFASDFFNGLFEDSTSFEVFVVVILQFILFLHLTAFLSLVIKRGALPLAIAIQYLGGSFFTTFLGVVFMAASRSGPDVMFVLMGLFCAVMTVVLHVAIGHRLSTVAAQE